MGERKSQGIDLATLKIDHTEKSADWGAKAHFVIFISTGFYSGFSPIAPGTAGTLVGAAVCLAIFPISPLRYLAFIIPVLLAAVWFSGKAEALFDKKDYQAIVIDEICGFIVAMFMVPISSINILWGVMLFRLFDIWKPFGQLERLKSGFGVVADDLAAGLSTNIILQFLRLFGLSWP